MSIEIENALALTEDEMRVALGEAVVMADYVFSVSKGKLEQNMRTFLTADWAKKIKLQLDRGADPTLKELTSIEKKLDHAKNSVSGIVLELNLIFEKTPPEELKTLLTERLMGLHTFLQEPFDVT